jgi:hypothetical protein
MGISAPTTPDGEYTVTLPVSKDNVIFGVRAVDAQVPPMPAR